MRGLRVVLILAMLISAPWLSIQSGDTVVQTTNHPNFSNSINGEMVAIPGDFNHTNFVNYSDVAVIINNRSTESVLIGNAFASARGIPPERVFLLTNESTPTGETINANEFDTFFADPIREMIQQRGLFGDLNYLVTTKGTPLRVNGGTNVRASFDSELALIDSGQFGSLIHGNYWGEHNYGPWSNENGDEYAAYSSDPVPEFRRSEQGFYIVTRLTGYDVDTALSLIEKANNSLGSRGNTVLDLATNRNGSGYKYWNDALYRTNSMVNGTLGLPSEFNQNSTYLTNVDEVIMYAGWGSNDDSWGGDQLSDSGLDNPDGSTTSGIRSWEASTTIVSSDETIEWSWDDSVKRNGNGAAVLEISSSPCSASNGEETFGLLAEYFDNQGLSYNSSFMPDLTNRTANHIRSESNIDQSSVNSPWPGLDSRFQDYFSARHTGVMTIPESGNWTIYSNADDGTMIWIDDALVVNNSGVHSMREVSSTVYLDQGEHRFRSEFFEQGGWAGHILSWEGPNQSKQTIPASAFTRAMSTPVRSDILAHHWDFESGNGSIVEDMVGDANLTMSGSPTWQSCLLGNCIHLDGVDDELHVDVDDRLGNFTVSLWAKANHTGQPGYASVVAVNDVGGDFDSFQIMTSGSTPGVWQLYHNTRYDFGPVSASEWVHFVVAKEGDRLMQYMDGVLIRNITLPTGAIDEIDLYKFGVNRAGNTHWAGLIDEVQIWTEALNTSDITLVNGEVALDCPAFSSISQQPNILSTNLTIGEEKSGHAWIVSGYGQSIGEINADWRLKVEAFDGNNTLLSENYSDSSSITPSWVQRTMRFRPHENATSFRVSYEVEILNISRDGTVHFDTTNLQIIRPHMDWLDGSIAETAVSTSGRSFTLGTSYGQSLVADLLEDGVSGVKGYVYEPYLTAVSYPDLLTSYYASGYNLGEAYTASNSYLSWMGVIVGDPKMSPFSDRLHDIEIRNVSVENRPSVNTQFDVHVELANIGISPANGWLEIRERVGNRVLSNISISIPSGNQNGSVAIVSVPTITETTGFVELQARYIANNGIEQNSTTFVQSHILTERMIENNIASTIIEVNGPPSIDLIDCSSSIAARGSTVSCWLDSSDEFGVESAFFTINGTNQSIIFEGNGTSGNGNRWTIFFDIPGYVSLGFYDIFVRIIDIDGLSVESNESAIIEIIDSPSIWYGIHILGADDPTWTGDTTLPSGTPYGMFRGVSTPVRACVEDVDHDPTNEAPTFLFERGELSSFQILPKENSSRFQCYKALFELDLDEPLSPFLARLADSEGNILTTRSILVENLNPSIEATFQRDGNNSMLGFGVGNESVLVSVNDPDSPLSTIIGQIEYSWPNQAPQTVPFSVLGDGNPIDVQLLPPSPGLSAGNLLIRISAIDSDAGLSILDLTIPIETRPPSVTGVVLCANGQMIPLQNGTELVRGESMFLVVPIDEHRSLLQISPSLRQSGWSESLFQAASVPDSCSISPHVYVVDLPPDLIEGNASIVIILSDIDGLVTGWTEDVRIIFPPPSILNVSWPNEADVGEKLFIELEVRDADDLNEVICSIDVQSGNSSLLHLEQNPDLQGKISVEWVPSRPMENVNATIVCLDGMNRYDVWDSENSINISGNITIQLPDIIEEEPELEKSSIEGLFPIVISIFILLTLITCALLWVAREKDTISLSPWEIGGILDPNQVESEDEPLPEKMHKKI